MNNFTMIEIHDIVVAHMPDSDFYIVGRVSFLDYQPKSTKVESYGITHYDRNNQAMETTANQKNVKLLNTENSHINSLLPVPSIDELEERFYEKYGEATISINNMRTNDENKNRTRR